MKMFIANCTKQVQDFIYRPVESRGNRMQRIEIGQQIQLAGDLNQSDIDAIVDHHALYGLLSVEDARKVRGRFVGMCYSIDKPVKIEDMQIVLSRNDDVLTDRGQELRKEAAVATSAAIQQGGDNSLRALETSITEVKKDGGEPDVQEGVRVDRNAGAKEQRLTGNEAKGRINKGR